MAPENCPSGPRVESKPYDPELLMAARRGDFVRLERLLPSSAELGAPQFVIPIECDDQAVAADALEAKIMPSPAAAAKRDSLLHAVASSGDVDAYLKCASVIHSRASHLLDARNKNGDTPLHCATRAGRGRMVAHLLLLARSENGGSGGNEKVTALLRAQNKSGETVLHQAVRLGDGDMVGRLMAEDPELARVPLSEGASPLYLAVEMGRDDIARQLYHKDPALSYSGPDGRNALHAAVLMGQETTKMLLEWNTGLIKESDRSTGSTPLHFAASWGRHKVISLLLAADPSAAYQSDSKGSFPIHLAASADSVKAVSVLLGGRHDCAELLDARGRTFLHVAVREKSFDVVYHACEKQSRKLAASPSFMNMQDDDGNTALHSAVVGGHLWIFSLLMENRSVKLDLTNNKGQTPRQLAWANVPAGAGVRYGPDASSMIHKLLQDAGAPSGTHRRDLLYEEHILWLDQKEEAEKIATSTQIVGLGSVLIATAAFAAAFTLPGGYRGDDDHENGGTPTLVGHSAFHVFIIADTFAFIFSSLSITLLIYAGIASSDIRTRVVTLGTATTLMLGSARSLIAAFVIGLYVVLAPVARRTAMASFAITALAFADAAWLIFIVWVTEQTLLKRLGARAAWRRMARAILVTMLSQFWPYIVIAGVVTCVTIKRGHALS